MRADINSNIILIGLFSYYAVFDRGSGLFDGLDNVLMWMRVII
jgi:hypothetical protein